MGKYTASTTDIFSVFASVSWNLENIKTFPEDFVGSVAGNEYIRVTVLPSGKQVANFLKSVSGQLLIEIFVPAGNGPSRINQIADILDKYLSGQTMKTGLEGQTQFASSSLSGGAYDRANPALYRTLYTIPFNYYGV